LVIFLSKLTRWCAVAVCAAVVVVPAAISAKPPAAVSPELDELRAKYDRLSSAYTATVPGWRTERPVSGSLLFIAPDQYSDAKSNGEQFRAARNKYADALFELAKQAADAGQMSLAFEWATEAVRENPDHADARRVLGYELVDGQWLTPFAKRMVDAGKRWDPKRGWVVADEAPQEQKPTKNGWRVRTDHFFVTSNQSQAAAAEMAARLERLHQIWRQLFAGFNYSEREVRELFVGERPPRERHQPFRVFYHRDKDDYVSALARVQPRIAETLGIYFDADREAHFFAGDDRNVATLNHEAVHQLFQETRPAARHVGELANFWVVEGIATYFETLREHRDSEAGLYYTIGESSAGRLPAARERLLVEKFYVPLDELTRLDKDDLQRYPELAKLYSQSAGMAAMLMDGESGHYREALVEYLSAVYAGRDNAQSLPEATGSSLTELDAAYRRYLESLP
jgi:Protein of unknown function (DUF1570)